MLTAYLYVHCLRLHAMIFLKTRLDLVEIHEGCTETSLIGVVWPRKIISFFHFLAGKILK